jgi:hypothetical protein
MTDWRALCAELLEAWDSYGSGGDAWDRARAALAKPEPEGPSDEVKGLHGKFIIHKANGEPVKYPCFVLRIDGKDAAAISAFRAYAIATEDTKLRQDMLELISPLAQPEPEGPSDKELDHWIMAQPHQQWVPKATDPIRCHELDQHELRDFARAVLARWGRPAIQPVPVTERLPGPEDCDEEGRCWWGYTESGNCAYTQWQLKRQVDRWGSELTWLPHHALPVPTSQEAP